MLNTLISFATLSTSLPLFCSWMEAMFVEEVLAVAFIYIMKPINASYNYRTMTSICRGLFYIKRDGFPVIYFE